MASRSVNGAHCSSFRGAVGRPYDISPDDQRFILVRTVGTEEAAPAPLILVQNWFEELKARVGR